jgi:hypothetical protein
MGMLELLLGKKRKTDTVEQVTAVIKYPTEPVICETTVVLKGKKEFDLYEDGNGYYRAQHHSGKWIQYGDHLCSYYEYAEKYRTLSAAQEAAIKWLKNHQLSHVGTIKFIPTK